MPYSCPIHWVGYDGVICQRQVANTQDTDKHSFFSSHRRNHASYMRGTTERAMVIVTPCSFLPGNFCFLAHTGHRTRDHGSVTQQK